MCANVCMYENISLTQNYFNNERFYNLVTLVSDKYHSYLKGFDD